MQPNKWPWPIRATGTIDGTQSQQNYRDFTYVHIGWCAYIKQMLSTPYIAYVLFQSLIKTNNTIYYLQKCVCVKNRVIIIRSQWQAQCHLWMNNYLHGSAQGRQFRNVSYGCLSNICGNGMAKCYMHAEYRKGLITTDLHSWVYCANILGPKQCSHNFADIFSK